VNATKVRFKTGCWLRKKNDSSNHLLISLFSEGFWKRRLWI